ncbi:MAG: SAM-dependent DNA methyltransferase [Planctomycetes bacterium]|nr:SAM-dependent DNA methyltransferase [Planctomycetota bacterium]
MGTQSVQIPQSYSWKTLKSKDGEELEKHYRRCLEGLAKEPGMLGVIFRKSQNKIQDPAKLKRLIGMIDTETWSGMDIDIKGEIYEGLLEKNAQDTKSGAGQYFTPRALIQAMVECVAPKPKQKIADPACGTGGFILAAHDYLQKNHKLNKAQKEALKSETFKGWELVDNTARLCVLIGVEKGTMRKAVFLSDFSRANAFGIAQLRFDFTLHRNPQKCS